MSSSDYRKLQGLLVTARKTAGLTQMQVAERLGRPQSYVSKYENGERNLDVIDFVAVCQVLGVAPSGLLEEIGRPPGGLIRLQLGWQRAQTKSPSE